jgi:hypothetical protein
VNILCVFVRYLDSSTLELRQSDIRWERIVDASVRRHAWNMTRLEHLHGSRNLLSNLTPSLLVGGRDYAEPNWSIMNGYSRANGVLLGVHHRRRPGPLPQTGAVSGIRDIPLTSSPYFLTQSW